MAPSALTPLALENAPLLRRLQAQDFASKTALAKDLGRDLPNLNKTLKRLEEEGLALALSTSLTDAGANAVRDLERLDAAQQDFAPPADYLLLTHAQIARDELNPRKAFDEAELAELATSIEQDGLLENLVVRRALAADGSLLWCAGPGGDLPLYRLVAGERRWRAIGILIEGATWPVDRPILCKTVDLDDAGHRRVALIENLQRVDLKPLEEARALKELMEVSGVGTAEIAADIRRTQRFVQQRLQLLKMPPIKQVELEQGRITVEDARRWIAEQPKPYDLGATQALVLLEVAWAISATRGADRFARTPIDHHRPAHAPEACPGKPLLQFHNVEGPGCEMVGFGTAGWQHLQALAEGADPLSRTILDPHLRKARRAMLPTDLEGPAQAAEIDRLFASKTYMTAWLNPPFEVSPARLRAAREQERQREQNRREDQARRDVEASQQRERQEQDRANRTRAEALLGAIFTFEQEVADASAEDFAARFRALLESVGYAPPFTVIWDGRQPVLRDAAGADWSGPADLIEGLRRVMAIAVNRLLGLPPVSGPALDDTPWALAAREAAEDAALEAEPAE